MRKKYQSKVNHIQKINFVSSESEKLVLIVATIAAIQLHFGDTMALFDIAASSF